MTTLKDAIKQKNLDKFIKEREKEQRKTKQKGDKAKFDSTLFSMVSQKKKSTPQTSPENS